MIDLPSFFGIDGLTGWQLALVIGLGLSAGLIDAIVGGGGLLQLPALLLIPGISPVSALATNKLGSIAGTSTSAVTYYRRTAPDLRTALPMAGFALAGSFGGAMVATMLPTALFKPIILVALVVVALITAARPNLGQVEAIRYHGRRHYAVAASLGVALGFYDGLLGPGTGTFLVLALVGVLGYNFLQASAKAKIVNFATNLGALFYFAPHGVVLWRLGILLAIANGLGGYLGSRMAISKGNRFIRVVFLVVVFALLIKLGIDVFSPPGDAPGRTL